ncbi:INO80 complex subunit B [Brachypodium distachyon]|uniref:INO80 complex subunit B-like conserved region domain-containing protein n=1 Tax=Brachypodium distachyon TaxID=15368 RepID=I1GLR6_BRADI|nr:INO80 complex subunit B [Brachypodium distachyon]KQK12526.1 hypothetical protein BRADI_1g04270v3 [Brachypodium distachyon]PNT73923.1 hypothetical protein BRADI_1g04270v3 [Brachypodium distachyon]|eukprot:XP_003563915.1 INO80 complex subunit B [Brachypodium distachyon]
MEGRGKTPLNVAEAVLKRPRSVASRKPRPKDQLASEYKDISCAASSRSISPDDDTGVEGSGHRRKELYLNGPEMRGSAEHRGEVSKKARREDRAGGDHDVGHNRSSKSKDSKHSSQGVLALACARNSGSPDNSQLPSGDTNVPPQNRVRKLKLKVSGLTRTVHTKPIQEAGEGGTPGTSDGSFHCDKQKDSGQQKHHSTNKDTQGNHIDGKHGDKHGISPPSDLVRKSKRVPKKRTLESDDEDGELRYLEKLKAAKVAPEQTIATDHSVAYDYLEDGLRKKKLSKVSKNRSAPYEVDDDFTVSQSIRDGSKKLKLGGNDDFIEEEESGRDEPKEADSPSSVKIETPGLTTRQRALHGRGGHGESVIEFPDGLPTAPSRRQGQKEKLSEVEIQAKKAEVAQRRKMQVEKAEREQQTEAMRKILGIDTEKKKEERKQKEREDKEKQARFEEYKRSCIQCVMRPEGTVITFPEKMGLPSIFNSKPISYPPPREKCAGPSCPNPYKYRDSKTKLPLCSLQCYKAVQGSNGALAC